MEYLYLILFLLGCPTVLQAQGEPPPPVHNDFVNCSADACRQNILNSVRDTSLNDSFLIHVTFFPPHLKFSVPKSYSKWRRAKNTMKKAHFTMHPDSRQKYTDKIKSSRQETILGMAVSERPPRSRLLQLFSKKHLINHRFTELTVSHNDSNTREVGEVTSKVSKYFTKQQAPTSTTKLIGNYTLHTINPQTAVSSYAKTKNAPTLNFTSKSSTALQSFSELTTTTFEQTTRSPAVIPVTVKLEKVKVNIDKYEPSWTESDNRPSAVGIGSIGVIIIVAVIAGIIFLDSATIYKDVSRLKRRFSRFCRGFQSKQMEIACEIDRTRKWANFVKEHQKN